MLSIDFLRKNPEKVRKAAVDKNRLVDIDKILTLDDNRRKYLQTIQKLRAERNLLAKQKITPEIVSRGKNIKEEIKSWETKLTKIEKELNKLLQELPNIPLDEVPVGKTAADNKEIKRYGQIPNFDFHPLSHLQLGKKLDIIDFERGAKVSGFRGYFLKNEGAILQLGILIYVFQKLVKKGFTPIIPPTIVKEFTLFGSGQLPWGKDEVYKLNDTDAYLAGTAEVPVTAYYSQEILTEDSLPQRFIAISPCYRREAGAYGKDTKGLYRLHEFWKIEQVIIARNNLDETKKLHNELQLNAEEILQDLKLPYRRLLMCTGEMGEPQMLKYDTEVWMPSRGGYGETMSNSLMGDFQTRRLNIKYRGKDGQTHFAYSLNNTAIASPRILIALLENNQKKDGSISIPEVLVPHVGFSAIKPKNK